MNAVIDTMIFSGAFATASLVIGTSVAPQWRRIMRLATGHRETAFAPLATLVHAERRIAIRRWAPAPVHQMRAAA